MDHGNEAYLTAAHELGHCLGASHDGAASAKLYNQKSCKTGEYLMSTMKHTSINRFVFSKCSQNAIYETIMGLKKTNDSFPRVCLSNKVCGHNYKFIRNNQPYGQIESHQQQCKKWLKYK